MINRDNKKAITKKGMISNRLNKFSIRKYTVGTASILVGTTLIFGLGNQEAKAAENTSTENAKQDDATTSDNKEVVSETENNSTTENDSTNPIKKETNTDSQPEAKEESTTSSTQQQQNNVTATTETKPQNIEKENVKPSTDKTATEDTSVILEEKKAPNYTNNDVTTKPSTSEIQTKPTTPQESTNIENSQPQPTPSKVDNQVTDATNPKEPVNVSKEELKNNPEKLKELVRNDNNTDRSTKPVATAPTSVAPKRLNAKMRFAVAQPAAVASNNVNDLITVTKQTIKVGDGKDNVAAAHDGKDIEYDTEFTIDNKVKKGDTMTINYDKNVIPSDLTDKNDPIDITDPSGEVIAKGTFDKATKQITYTFTDYVDKYEDIKARLTLYSYIDKQAVPNETSLNLTFATAGKETSQNVSVDYQDPMVHGDSNIQSIFTKLDENKQTIEQQIYVNPLKKTATNTKVDIAGSQVDDYGNIKLGNGSTIIDQNTEIKVYKVNPNQQLPQSNRIYDFSQYEDVTSQFDNKKSFSNNVATLDFGDINSAYIIKVVSKYTPTSDGELDIAQGTSMRTTDKYGYYNYAGYSNFIVTSNDTGGGDGTVKPEEKLYKIGDYVWEDVDKDGVQGTDSKEKPMANVLVTLTYPDGTTKSVRTDANGHYEFGGLKDGETYTVKFETPAGYLPTKVNGTTDGEKDSNGSSITVKINGKDDMSLDTGFYKEPKYNLGDYVWEDTNKDGIQDANEPGIKDVKVTLKDSTGKVIGTTTTDASGKYKFTDLDNGNYTVEFETPAGYTPTVKNTTAEDKDSNGLTTTGVIKDADNMTLDSGFYKTPKYSLGDYVWYDSNKDGKQDSTEKGIKDVKVTLLNEKGEVIGTTKTDENGKYRFDNLYSGKYKVIFEKPAGLTQTVTNTTEDDKDADGGEVDVTITDHDDFTLDNGY
ncbi:TPA: fibrinogen-binding adhesin SdrG C-terminal domain-containing protein, partial [Staphylococcus aureus]|nr:fibrinogen-binding adhesin SdrG C-terminal domain-containing protein [Staphylococcus aureus]